MAALDRDSVLVLAIVYFVSSQPYLHDPHYVVCGLPSVGERVAFLKVDHAKGPFPHPARLDLDILPVGPAAGKWSPILFV